MIDDNFLEKMMELGIGLSVIRQMPQMVEGIMPKTKQSSAHTTPPSLNSKDAVTYIAVDGQQVGPLTEKELKVLCQNGILTADTLVWMPNLINWTQADTIPQIKKILLLASLPSDNMSKASQPSINNQLRNEVVGALAQLGYNNASVRKVIDEVLLKHPDITTADAIKEVLRSL